MRLSNRFDYYLKRTKRYSYALGNIMRIKKSGSYWSKYHDLYLKGEFNFENKKHFLEEWFVNSVKYFPDIKNPKTFNEKIQWYKLYYNDPLIVKCIDKISFKDYVKEMLGAEYAIPLLGEYSNADEIDFDKLPNQFVIKANFGSDGKQIIIVTDKSKLDLVSTRKTISSWEKPWWRNAWGGYEFVQPKILIEEYIEQIDGQVYDYKFMCFNGEPNYIVVSTDRFKNHRIDFFDIDWKKLDIFDKDYPNSKREIEKPVHLSKMIDISRKLSKQFPLVRVDFFEAGNGLYVGELTFYPGGGMNHFGRTERDYQLGELLKLPGQLN